MKAKGNVFKYGDNVDTDVIIPARYLNSSDPSELATHCMEDIDADFAKKVGKEGRFKNVAVAINRNGNTKKNQNNAIVYRVVEIKD